MKFKRFLSLALAFMMVFSICPMQVFAETTETTEAPALPTATVSDVENDELTFAKKFGVVFENDDANSYYGSWEAEYVIATNKDVTFDDSNYFAMIFGGVQKIVLTLEAGEEFSVIEAMRAQNPEIPTFTLSDIINNEILTFGAYFTEEFLNINKGLEINYKLVISNGTKEYTIGNYTYPEKAPALPTATVGKIYDEKLTFGMNFTAAEPDEEQLEYYGAWLADFEFVVDKDIVLDANGTGDGWLSGRYDEWNNGEWVNVPTIPVTIEANKPVKIMEFAAELLGETGLKLTYEEVYKTVKSFDCGIFLDEEFIKENPNFNISVGLNMYEPAEDGEEPKKVAIGEPAEFTEKNLGEGPALPGAVITNTPIAELDAKVPLTFAKKFTAKEPTESQLNYYGKWYADFVLTVNKDVTFNANGTADGYLAGEYGSYGWVKVPPSDVTIEAGESLKIMDYAATLLGESGLQFTYKEICELVKEFNCGAYFTPEFLAANPDFEVTLDLRMYETADAEEGKVIGETFVFTAEDAIPLPTATVTEIEKEDLTFAMNFKADNATENQLAYYGNWYADFELTVSGLEEGNSVTFNADGTKDGWLSGQYDEWSKDWVNVPFGNKVVTLNNGESIRIMAKAAEIMGEPGLKYTYKEVYEVVEDFDCGVFFDEEFLEANPNLVVTLALKMYDPADETGTKSYVIGETYTFRLIELPTATATEIENKDLTFAMNFVLDEVSPEQIEYYGNWYADFEFSVNKDVTLNADGTKDGYLSGEYGSYGWVNVPFTTNNRPNGNVELEAGKAVRIMALAAELMGEPGLKVTFKDICDFVKDFNCGAYFTPDFLEANPDLQVKLELKMYNPANEEESYVIGETYIFNSSVAQNTRTEKYYDDLQTALDEAGENGDTVILLKNVKVNRVFIDGTLDLNGYTLEAGYVSSFGNIVDYSEDNSGLLVVPEGRIMLQQDNTHLPVKTAEGNYAFVEVLGFNQRFLESSGKFVFQPLFEEAAHELLLNGATISNVQIAVIASWKKENGDTRSQNFVYNDTMVGTVINSYNHKTGKYDQMFTIVLQNVPAGLNYQVAVISGIGVKVLDENIVPHTFPATTTTEQVTINAEDTSSSALVAEGTKVTSETLTLAITQIDESKAEVTISGTEEIKSVDVHIEGIADDNTVPAIITVKELASVGLNEGNLSLYHVENGETVPMTRVYDVKEVDAHNEFYYDPATGDVTMALATFSEVAVVADTTKAWEGNFDYSWYTNVVALADEEAADYTIANADQLAAFGAIVGGMDGQTQYSFKGKTIKLVSDINLGDDEENNDENKIFYPIGYNSDDGKYEKTGEKVTTGFYAFEGTFDGNGHTISNFYHNTWEMKGDHNWYDAELQYYRDGMGLFGKVYGGTVKNLTVDNFSSDGEIATTGVIAAYADGATFENIAVTNCNPRVYNIGNGGIVGCVGWYAKDENLKTTFTNITVDNSNKISALWGTYDAACGGIVGQYYPTSGQTSAGTPKNAGIDFVNCHVSAQMDVYNDVCGNYQYYAYRYTGMMIGSVRENTTNGDGKTIPDMTGISATGCTVNYGDWNDYYYCEFEKNGHPSYSGPDDYKFSRVPHSELSFTDSNGNGVVDADERASVTGCKHDHTDAEDNQAIYLPFHQLFTGYGWGVNSIGLEKYSGIVTNLDITEGDQEESVKKFEGKVTELSNNTAIKLGDIFTRINEDVKLVHDALTVTVTNLDESNPVSASFVRDAENWENGILTLTGTGNVQITIQDYYFCKPTTINVTIEDREAEEKFDIVFPNTATYLYRVGNQNTVKLDSLFKAKDGATIGTVSVNIENVNGASGTYTSNATWNNGTIQFSGTGVVKVTIEDDDTYCTPTVLYLEVVDAKNATTATSATANNVVLLNDISGGFTVSGRYTVYGNGFTLNYTGNGQYLNNGLKQGVVTVSENGTLDNLRIKASIYPDAYLYYGSAIVGNAVKDGPSDGNNRFYYQLSAVAASGNATISNCYIYGGRNNIFINTGDVTVTDTVLENGVVANVQIQSNASHTITFENVTTISHQVNPTIGDTTKVMLGAGILVGPETTENPTIVLNGDFKQYNWVTADDAESVSGEAAKLIINGALDATAYNHTINGETASNLGIIYMNTYAATVTNDTGLPYVLDEITMSYGGNSVKGKVYSLQNATAEQISSDIENADRDSVNGYYEPQFKYSADLGGQYIEKDSGDEHCYREGDTIHVMFPSGDTKELDLAAFVDITKYSGQALNLVVTCKDENGNAVTVTDGKITLSDFAEYTVTYSVTDTLFYDKDGKTVTETKTYSWDVDVSVSLKDTSVPNAYFDYDTTKQTMGYAKKNILSGGNTQYLPFLAGLKIYDYIGQEAYLRFDGDNDFNKIASAEITDYTSANHVLIEVKLTDGGVINVDTTARAASGGSTYTGTLNTSGNTLYYVNAGTTSATTTTWVISNYSFTGNNGVTIDSGAVTFSNCENGSVPTGSFSTTIKYTVTYDANEGNCGQTVGYATSASATVTLPTPTRSGYMFVGWYDAKEGGNKAGGAGESYTPTTNVTLYAQWGKPSTVTYDANGGSCDKESDKYTGTALTLPTPTRDGYWFTGWYDAAEGGERKGGAGASYQATGDITLYAQWSPVYTVTYNANGGSVTPASAKYEGTALTLPVPTRDGYAFNGWYTAASGGTKVEGPYTPTADITLYAQWKDPVTVTYNANGGSCPTASQTYLGTALTLPTPTRTGYKFLGWYTAASGGTKVEGSYTPEANITLYAQWTGYVVTYNANSGSCSTASQTYEGTALTLPTATRSNYTFNGWYTATSGGTKIGDAGASYTPTADITLYAQWTYSGGCVTPDTIVTLADGSRKRIDNVSANEEFLVWDFVNGEYTVAPASILINHGEGTYNVATLYFSDGAEINTINGHGFFHKVSNKFVIIDENNAEDYIGEVFLKQDGDGFATATLVDVKIEEKVTESWGILTAVHYNCFLEGMLTMTDAEVKGTPDYLMPFEIGEDMKYDEVKMQADIEKYGLYCYNNFENLCTYEQFVGFGMDKFKVSVAKGYITMDEIEFLLSLYA